MGQKITKIAGNTLGTTYAAWIDAGLGYGLPPAVANLVQRVGQWPRFASLGRPGRRFALHVVILSGGGDTERKNLFGWLDPESESSIVLTATDEDGSSNSRYLNVICEACQPVNRGDRADLLHFVATCVVDGDVRWRAVTGDSTAWSVTSDGDTEVVANGGEDEVYPVFTVKPTSNKAGSDSDYRRWIMMRWNSAYTATDYPFRIGTIDTAALIKTATTTTLNGVLAQAATTVTVTDASSFPTSGMAYITDAVPGDEQISWTGKSGNDLTGVTRGIGGTADVAHSNLDPIAVSSMLANGDDMRVFINGTEETNRWFDGLDGANTYIWTYTDFSAKQHFTLDGDIAVDATELVVNEAITSMPGTGILYLDTEAVTYSGKNNTDKKFTGLTRAAKDTTAATHSSGANVYWVENDIWVYYGDEGASAPGTDDDYEPAFDITNSTNLSWDYNEFGEDDGLRLASWEQQTFGSSPAFYTANQDSDADPWEELGVKVDGYYDRGRWRLNNPCYVTAANFQNGEKYAVNKSYFVARIQSSADGSTWADEYAVPAPGANSNWEAWSRDETITASRPYVGLALLHTSGSSYAAKVEAADVTLTLNSSYTPTVTVSSAVANDYTLACTITNNTTGKSISLVYAGMTLDDELEVDTDDKTVTDLTDDSSQFQSLTVDSGPRRHWLPLNTGNNTLQYDEDDAAGVTVTVEFEKRYYS